MTTLSKDNKAAIFSAVRLKTESIAVPEWGDGVTVIISEMSGLARDTFYAKRADGVKLPVSESQAGVLLATVVDETGTLVLTDEDIEPLRAQSSIALDRVSEAAMRLNGMLPTAVEDAIKNSVAAPSGDSGSNSASTSASQ